MPRHRIAAGLALILLSLTVGGCGSDGGDEDTTQTTVATSEAGRMLGPSGEEVTSADEIKLSAEDVDALKQARYAAAIVWHDVGADYSKGIIRGIKDRFGELGIEVAAITDAAFDPAKEQRDIETVLAGKPDAIISIPVDPVSAAKSYRPAGKSGVKLAFLSNIPKGYEHGKDYVGVVTGDEIVTGGNTAKIMCDALNGEGEIGYIFHEAEFFITNQRDAAFREALERDCPGVEVAAEAGFEDPARVQEVASAMLTRNPNLDGIYTTWAQPAEGVLAALREAGREQDVKVVTVDLSQQVALDIAKGGPTAGVSTDHVYETGSKLADVVALGLLGKSAPAFAAVPSLAVTKDNLLEGWQDSYEQPAPGAIQEAAAKQ